MEGSKIKYRVVSPIKTLCCKNNIDVDDEVEVIEQTSPNRLSIRSKNHNGGCHNIKRSIFYRCVKEVK